MNICEARVAQKSPKGLDVLLDRQVQVDDGRGFWHQSSTFPIYSPRVAPSFAQGGRQAATAREDLEAEGALAIHKMMSITAEAPLGPVVVVIAAVELRLPILDRHVCHAVGQGGTTVQSTGSSPLPAPAPASGPGPVLLNLSVKW